MLQMVVRVVVMKVLRVFIGKVFGKGGEKLFI